MISDLNHISITSVEECLVVRFNALPDVVGDEELVQQIGTELGKLADLVNVPCAILDFENTTFIPYASFEIKLVQFYKQMNRNVIFCNLPENVLEHFRINHLEKVFEIYQTLPDAMNAAKSRAKK